MEFDKNKDMNKKSKDKDKLVQLKKLVQWSRLVEYKE